MRRLFRCSAVSAACAGLLVCMVTCGAAAQEFAGREKLRAHSAEFRREVINVTNNPTKLFPLSERDRAARVIELAGGREQLLSRARRAMADKDFQWAAELTDYVLAIEEGNVEAKRLKAAALSELGERQISAIARNYYLSAAQYLLRDLPAR